MNGPIRRGSTILGAVLATGLMATASVHEAFACGYHDPQLVSRGFLNWIYPESLHVLGAISMEIGARRLPPPKGDPTAPDLFRKNYRGTATVLMQFGKMLGESGGSQPPASLVLLEPMLWTRFEHGPQGIDTQVHVAGPLPRDLVLVSGEVVVSEIVAGRLTLGAAYSRGLLRFYGPDREIARFLAVHEHVGATSKREASAPPDPAGFAWSAPLAAEAPRHLGNNPKTAFKEEGNP